MSDSAGGNKRTDLLTVLNKSASDYRYSTSLECFGAAGEWSMVSFVACYPAELLCPDERCSGNVCIQISLHLLSAAVSPCRKARVAVRWSSRVNHSYTRKTGNQHKIQDL